MCLLMNLFCFIFLQHTFCVKHIRKSSQIVFTCAMVCSHVMMYVYIFIFMNLACVHSPCYLHSFKHIHTQCVVLYPWHTINTQMPQTIHII